jgi:hypothetical protein
MSAESSSAAAVATAAPAATAAAPSRPLIGIGVLIVDPQNHPGAILIGERKGSHGAATFATPGEAGVKLHWQRRLPSPCTLLTFIFVL